jgi:hypothetical protein
VAADAQKKISILVSDEDGVDPEVVRITSKRSWGILVRRPGPTREPEAFRLRESTPSLRGRVVRFYFIEPVRNYSVVDSSEGRQRSGAVGAERTGLERRGLRSRASGGGSPEGQGHGDEGATSAVGALARIATHEALKEVSPVFAMVAGRV